MNDANRRRLRDTTSGPGTLISEGCRIEGLLSGNGHFMVNGVVEGECDVNGSLTVAEKGLWKGVIRADSVIVAGAVEGDIVAVGQVEINDTAKIRGTVTGRAIAVAEGAIVDGVMQTTGQVGPQGFVEKRQGPRDSR